MALYLGGSCTRDLLGESHAGWGGIPYIPDTVNSLAGDDYDYTALWFLADPKHYLEVHFHWRLGNSSADAKPNAHIICPIPLSLMLSSISVNTNLQ